MSNKQGKYKKRQWTNKGGQGLAPISAGNIGAKKESWMQKRKRAKRQQG